MEYLKRLVFFKLAVIYLRYLIGFAFMFASLVKIQGDRFTIISVDQPVGYFFEAMYQTGLYWNFLGWGQFIAGTLLMTQRFATIGVMIFLPIMLNVFIITHAIDFGPGTPIITTLMLLATIFLLLWDYKKWIFLFQPDHLIKVDLTQTPKDHFMTDPIWAYTGITFIGITLFQRLTPYLRYDVWMILMVVIGVCAFILKIVKDRVQQRRVAPAKL